MSINELVKFIDNDNIAEVIAEREKGEDELKTIATTVIEWYEQDWASMDDWIQFADKGVELLKPELEGKSTPWENAANFKSPVMMEASLDFANRASLEILRPKNLVKAEVIGRDKDGKKQEQADRVTEYENFEINHRIKKWRKKQKKLFYSLPSFGTVFKKMVWDPLEGRVTTHLIQYPNFAISQGAESLEEARSFTQILSFSRNDVITRVNAGMWLDTDLYPEAIKDTNDSDYGSNEANDADTNEDNEDRFFEQNCSWDLDGDGVAEPYIITVHEATATVVRIVARYTEKSIIVEYNKVMMSLPEAVEKLSDDQINREEDVPEDTDYANFNLVRIEATIDIVQYGLIPSFNGTLLDLGYFHLLGALTMGINTTTNQLLDAGTLANRQSGFLAKGFRKKMGPLALRPGEFKSTNIDAAQLKNGILPMPIKEPSQTLFALNEKLEQTARQLSASTDLSGQLTAQTAPTTALALIHESLIGLSALMDNVISAMSDEFQILFNILQLNTDPELYKKVLDDEQADFQADFNSEMMDIVPTANPEMSSKAQRLQVAEALKMAAPEIVQMGGSGTFVLRNWVDSINADIVDQVFPEDTNLSPQDKQLIEQQTQAQEQANKLAEAELQNQNLQIEILQRDLERVESKTEAEVGKINAETKQIADKAQLELAKLGADIVLTLEKAESEDVKNQIGAYTARIAGITSVISSIGANANATSPAAVSSIPSIVGS